MHASLDEVKYKHLTTEPEIESTEPTCSMDMAVKLESDEKSTTLGDSLVNSCDDQSSAKSNQLMTWADMQAELEAAIAATFRDNPFVIDLKRTTDNSSSETLTSDPPND